MVQAPNTTASSPGGGLRRRGMAFLIPVLCFCSAALFPAVVDLVKLWSREQGLRWYQLLHATVFGLGLSSLVALPVALVVGLLVMTLVGKRDAAESQRRLLTGLRESFRRHNRRPEAAATVYSVVIAAGLLVGATYKITHTFFLTFKNIRLAALLEGCVMLALLLALVVVVLTLRVVLTPVMRWLGRLKGVKVLGWVGGALGVTLFAIAGVAVYLLIRYSPIVAIIDWRPLSYPAMILGGGVALALLLLFFRARRLAAGDQSTRLRRGLFAVWCAVLLGVWSYTFLGFERQGVLRTTLLRRAFGAAKSMDILTWGLDFDSDGYLSFFGGGDCAPFDEAVNPGASEIPDNGVDDNCFGGDLSLKRLKAPQRRFDHKLPPKLRKKKLNIVLVTLDGLRADHLGCYGYKKPTSPTIDTFARRAVLFERAYTQAPSTRYSIPSFMTSKYSSQIPRKAITDIPKPILPRALLMAEVLKDAGYRTGAALSYQVFHRSWQMDQGFDFYDNSQHTYYIGKGGPTWDRDQPYVLVDVAKRFLAKDQSKPFFLWVHFFEPHPPYVHRTKPRDFGSDMVGQYDGELRFADQKVSELLEAIQRHPASQRTVVMLAADHGRGLGEHGLATHGYDLYGENLHVPLLVHVPGLRPRRIKNPVAMLDLLPTMVNLARIRKKFDFEGESLVPQLVHGAEPKHDRPIFSEVQVGFHNSHVINAITTRDFKLIYDVTYNTFQLFDLRVDPGEKRDVAGQVPDQLNRMKGLLFKVMERGTLPAMQEEIQSSIVKNAPATPGITRVNFDNQIQFLGFKVNPERPRAGGVAVISWYVKALTRIKKDNKFIIQLKGSRGAFFDAKHVPVRGQFPTTKWVPGQVIRDRQHLRLPPAPQDYDVWVGFGTGHQILKPVGDHKVVNTVVKVGKITVH